MSEPRKEPDAKRAEELNQKILYTMYSVFKLTPSLGGLGISRKKAAKEIEKIFKAGAKNDGLIVRGVYDVSGFRADADIMIWWHAPDPDGLQRAYSAVRQSALGAHLEPVWSQMALHRPAEFNRQHIPAFLNGEDPLKYICVYPFVRSYEWYLLPDQERREMLAGHGKLARDYGDVQANTVAAFALGDYEWMLSFEAKQMHRIVDLMRELRAAEARRHVREEIPFYSGIRRPIGEILASMP